jgi:1-acyl-sn-glycerol-3-phosphate acyltransferase
VEDDPPTVPLRPGTVDYTGRRLSTRLQTWLANRVADAFFARELRKKRFFIKEVRGIENYRAVKHQGVMITANHFNAFDNYAVFKAIQKDLGRKRLYKIIREGNYTSFPGIYGYFFRHCNTLPLSADHRAFRELRDAIAVLLGRGEKILIYPEQGMWWNYRKPRPLKAGAFHFAAANHAPVLPFFLTMEDTDRTGSDGYPIQAYTVHILPAIHPDPALSTRENAQRMCDENFAAWKDTYEQFYGIPLTYTTQQ